MIGPVWSTHSALRDLTADACWLVSASWYLSRDQFADYGFADLLLLSPALRDSLPELGVHRDSDVDLGDGVLSDAPYVRAMNEMPREPAMFRTHATRCTSRVIWRSS